MSDFDTRDKWLASLVVGDWVGIITGYSSTPNSVKTVERVTATQLVVGGQRFRRKDGRTFGHSYGGPMMVEPTPEFLSKLRRRQLCNVLNGTHNWARYTTDQLEALVAILKAPGVPS